MNDFQSGRLKKAITFSYDDAVTQDVRLIDLMNRYGLKGTFNLNSQFLGSNGFYEGIPGIRVSHYKIRPEDVKYVYDGHEVAAHGLTHLTLTQQTDDEVIRQVEIDRQNLSRLAGYQVVGMAYPNGPNDDRVAGLIRENTGIKYSRTVTCTGSFDLQSNLYRFNPTAYHLDFDNLFRLGEQFLNMQPEQPQIFYIWGHSYELDSSTAHWVRLEEFFRLISGQKDIFYGTNKDILL